MFELTKELHKNGYLVIPNVLSKEACDAYVTQLEKAHEKYFPLYVQNKASHSLNDATKEKIVFNVHNKHHSFLDLIDNNKVYPIVKELLTLGSYNQSDPVILRQNTGRTPLKGMKAQQLHNDARITGCHFPIMAVVIWMLEDFTEENGATRIVPGSHKLLIYPKDNEKHPDEILVTGKKGTAVIIDGQLWHASNENKTNFSRWCILSTYTCWFYKTAFDFNRNMPISYYNMMTDRQKEIMGYTSNPPLDEFTRISARSKNADKLLRNYHLPK
jgi:ectoine hydroxylase-related dioxygenase (phytanoyl-CoA dioxygenase family)